MNGEGKDSPDKGGFLLTLRLRTDSGSIVAPHRSKADDSSLHIRTGLYAYFTVDCVDECSLK